MESKFKVGDVVVIKGQTVVMTVATVWPTIEYDCVYFDKNNDIHYVSVLEEMLEPIDTTPPF